MGDFSSLIPQKVAHSSSNIPEVPSFGYKCCEYISELSLYENKNILYMCSGDGVANADTPDFEVNNLILF